MRTREMKVKALRECIKIECGRIGKCETFRKLNKESFEDQLAEEEEKVGYALA